MLGMVFTEFAEMVEREHSADMLDDLIEACPGLTTGGAYTAVGSYDWRELACLLQALSERTGTPVPDLLVHFGETLFGRFLHLYPAFFDGVGSAEQFLRKVEDHVHVEVLKLYPQASLPRFDFEDGESGRFRMTYRSERPFADLAEGLVRGCVRHFGQAHNVTRIDLPASGGHACEFLLEAVETVAP